MHVFGLLLIPRVYAKPECTPMKHMKCVGKHTCSCKPKCMSEVCKTRGVRANHDAHGSRVMSRVYICARNVHFYIIDLSCTYGLCCEYFQKHVELCSCLMHA